MIVAMLLAITFSSCNKEGNPILYVVNASDYDAEILCDNHLVTFVAARNNSGKVELNNVSVNAPVYVEAYYYDKGAYTGKHVSWNYYFKWNKSYKLTLTNTNGRLEPL